jgi:hypothetical protein
MLWFAKMLFINWQKVNLIYSKEISMDMTVHAHFILVLLYLLVQNANKHCYEWNNKRFYTFIVQYSRNLHLQFTTPAAKLIFNREY